MTEHIDRIKSSIKEYVKEFRDKIQTVNKTIKNSKGKGLMTTTEGVNSNTWSCLEKHKINKDTCILINVIPILSPLLCHYNSFYIQNLIGSNKVNVIVGFNITANKEDGKFVSLELHSVVEIDKKLYDFTRDFNDETQKWFLPIRTIYSVKKIILFRDLMDYVGHNGGYMYPIQSHSISKKQYYEAFFTIPENSNAIHQAISLIKVF